MATILRRLANPRLVAVIDDATAYGEGLANEVENPSRGERQALPREKARQTTDWKASSPGQGPQSDAVF